MHSKVVHSKVDVPKKSKQLIIWDGGSIKHSIHQLKKYISNGIQDIWPLTSIPKIQEKLFYQTLFKTTLSTPKKPLHPRSQSRNRFRTSRSPAKLALSIRPTLSMNDPKIFDLTRSEQSACSCLPVPTRACRIVSVTHHTTLWIVSRKEWPTHKTN